MGMNLSAEEFQAQIENVLAVDGAAYRRMEQMGTELDPEARKRATWTHDIEKKLQEQKKQLSKLRSSLRVNYTTDSDYDPRLREMYDFAASQQELMQDMFNYVKDKEAQP